jgi:hypothetical protein
MFTRNKNKLIAVIILIVLLIAVFTVLFFHPPENPSPAETDEYTGTIYEVNIMCPENESYMLLLPVPVDENWSLSPVVDELKVTEGEGEFKVIHTVYGWAMEIHGKGNLSIKGENKYYEAPIFPSMICSPGPFLEGQHYPTWIDNIPRYWNTTIYSNNSLTLHILYSSLGKLGKDRKISAGWGTFHWDEENGEFIRTAHVEKGWNTIKLYSNILKTC